MAPPFWKKCQSICPRLILNTNEFECARNIENWSTYSGPTDGFVEQVYLLEPLGDENSTTMALLVNEKADIATSVRGTLLNCPTLQYENTASIEDGYVTVLSQHVFLSIAWWNADTDGCQNLVPARYALLPGFWNSYWK